MWFLVEYVWFLVVWSADWSLSGGSAPLVVRSIDHFCMVFGPGFLYKLG
jgi:hypothetical protein